MENGEHGDRMKHLAPAATLKYQNGPIYEQTSFDTDVGAKFLTMRK